MTDLCQACHFFNIYGRCMNPLFDMRGDFEIVVKCVGYKERVTE